MNKILDYNVTGQNIELASAAMLVAGTVNEYTARFAFDADWDGYQRIAVFSADGTDREQLLTDDVCKVPWEVLLPGAYLKVGVYGTRDGSRLPTIWTTHRQYIHDGAGPTDEAADPSPVLAEQILQRMGNLSDLKTEDKSSLVAAVNEVKETGGGGTADHAKLKNRDAADQHPMSAITGLEGALSGKQPTGDYLTEELDPTVPEWAKQPQKPAYTAQEVGALPDTTHIPSTAADVNAEPSGAVAQHNVSDAAHNDIRLLIQCLSERLSTVADSDDTTLDQLSEIVAYIKSNKILIDAITTSKVNVADIVDNLTTNVANKPLSAAQGVALKAIIDALTIPTALSELTEDTTHRVVTDAEKATWNAKSNFSGSYNDLTGKPTIPEAYTLPIASPTLLGGVQPVAKTDAMTQSVGVDEFGALWAPASGGGGGWKTYGTITVEVNDVYSVEFKDFTVEFEEFGILLKGVKGTSVGLVTYLNGRQIIDNRPYDFQVADRFSEFFATDDGIDGKYKFEFFDQRTSENGFSSVNKSITGLLLPAVATVNSVMIKTRSTSIPFTVGDKFTLVYR